MSDKAILKLFQNRQTFFQYREYVKEHALLDETKWLLLRYHDYYNNIAEVFDLEDFLTYISNLNGVNEEKFKKIRDVLLAVESYQNEALEEEVIKSYRKQELAEILSEKVNEALDGAELDLEEIKSEINEYEAHEDLEEELEFAPTSLDALYELNQAKPGLNWSLPTLNRDYGPAKRGDLIHIFANSNVGKTSFVVNECLTFMKQCDNDECVLWINNEEMITRVTERFNMCLAGGKVLVDDEQERKALQEQILQTCSLDTRLKALQVSTDSFTQSDYERHIARIKPRVVVFNNLDKIKKQAQDANSAEHLTQIYYWARTIASTYDCVVIGVAQASNEAVGKRLLDKSHLANCKVGKAGECDLIIGIGKGADDEEHRQINLVKNKFGPESHFTCRFEPVTGRYIEEVPETYGY